MDMAVLEADVDDPKVGAPEHRTGALISTVKGGELPGHNHRFEIIGNVREEECRALVQTFFREKR